MKEFFGSISTQDTEKFDKVIDKLTPACLSIMDIMKFHNEGDRNRYDAYVDRFLKSLAASGEYKSSMIANFKKQLNSLGSNL